MDVGHLAARPGRHAPHLPPALLQHVVHEQGEVVVHVPGKVAPPELLRRRVQQLVLKRGHQPGWEGGGGRGKEGEEKTVDYIFPRTKQEHGTLFRVGEYSREQQQLHTQPTNFSSLTSSVISRELVCQRGYRELRAASQHLLTKFGTTPKCHSKKLGELRIGTASLVGHPRHLLTTTYVQQQQQSWEFEPLEWVPDEGEEQVLVPVEEFGQLPRVARVLRPGRVEAPGELEVQRAVAAAQALLLPGQQRGQGQEVLQEGRGGNLERRRKEDATRPMSPAGDFTDGWLSKGEMRAWRHWLGK